MSYTHLTQEERYQIEELKREGYLGRAIAERLGRAASTVSRELKRNKGERGWRCCRSHKLAEERLKKRGHANARKISDATWDYAKNQLRIQQWSPEQIAGRLTLEKKEGISHETIYHRVLLDKKAGGELYKQLRCQKQRRKRYGSNRRKQPTIVGRVGIEERSAIVDRRERIGDWEGDTIIGAGCNSGAIVSSVERVSRFVILSKVKSKSPVGVSDALIAKMGPLSALAHTLTVDNGGEFSLHKKISQTLNMKIYFARPYHSYERGTNENTNGLVRQYFVKSMRFDTVSELDVQAVANTLNHRPRKCLGYQTPYEIFNKACKKKGIILRI